MSVVYKQPHLWYFVTVAPIDQDKYQNKFWHSLLAVKTQILRRAQRVQKTNKQTKKHRCLGAVPVHSVSRLGLRMGG